MKSINQNNNYSVYLSSVRWWWQLITAHRGSPHRAEWRDDICRDLIRFFLCRRKGGAGCARKNRHHFTNVITGPVVLFVGSRGPEHLLQMTNDRRRTGNYSEVHRTTESAEQRSQKQKLNPKKRSCDANMGKPLQTSPELRARDETEHKTVNVTNSTRISVICINGCSGTTAARELTRIAWPRATTHTKSGNNDDKPSGKWTHTVQREITSRPCPPSPCLDDKSYPAPDILRIIELIVICKFLCLESVGVPCARSWSLICDSGFIIHVAGFLFFLLLRLKISAGDPESHGEALR